MKLNLSHHPVERSPKIIVLVLESVTKCFVHKLKTLYSNKTILIRKRKYKRGFMSALVIHFGTYLEKNQVVNGHVSMEASHVVE